MKFVMNAICFVFQCQIKRLCFPSLPEDFRWFRRTNGFIIVAGFFRWDVVSAISFITPLRIVATHDILWIPATLTLSNPHHINKSIPVLMSYVNQKAQRYSSSGQTPSCS